MNGNETRERRTKLWEWRQPKWNHIFSLHIVSNGKKNRSVENMLLQRRKCATKALNLRMELLLLHAWHYAQHPNQTITNWLAILIWNGFFFQRITTALQEQVRWNRKNEKAIALARAKCMHGNDHERMCRAQSRQLKTNCLFILCSIK